VYTALGRVWLEQGELGDPVATTKALEALAPVSARPEASSEALALYGRALLLSGNPGRAEEILQRAVQRPPIDRLAYRDLAEAQRRLGRRSSAADTAARYAALAAD
jgi:predicted Zn-dependent protease